MAYFVIWMIVFHILSWACLLSLLFICCHSFWLIYCYSYFHNSDIKPVSNYPAVVPKGLVQIYAFRWNRLSKLLCVVILIVENMLIIIVMWPIHWLLQYLRMQFSQELSVHYGVEQNWGIEVNVFMYKFTVAYGIL